MAIAMCTLIAAVRMFPGAPLLVAANRDEALARPSRPPAIEPGSPKVLAPRDEKAGGTWLGLNEHGLFTGITNRAGTPPDLSRRSRGALVSDALQMQLAADLHGCLADIDPRAYNPFHLLYADRTSAHLTWSDGEKLYRTDLPDGLHVVTERSFGAAENKREPQIRALFEEVARDGEPSLDALARLLARHGDDPFAGVCVHADGFGYGTKSSFVMRLGDGAEGTKARWAEGKPCVTAFEDMGALLAALW